MYEQDTLSVLDAITEAQRIVLAPMLFQAALCPRNAGILDYLGQQGKQGVPLNAIAEYTILNEYAVGVLLDMGLSGRIITCKGGIYYLAKIDHYFLYDTMVRVNMDFIQDVCYQGLFFLTDPLSKGKSPGLKVFGDQPMIYPVLSQLPNAVRDSWFALDHYYSDGVLDAALPYVFANNPATLYDMGGNTGKWALCRCKFNENIAVTLLDLPQQIVLVKENTANAGFSNRIDFYAVDTLSNAPLPDEVDVRWMNQFLDCFLPE